MIANSTYEAHFIEKGSNADFYYLLYRNFYFKTLKVIELKIFLSVEVQLLVLFIVLLETANK